MQWPSEASLAAIAGALLSAPLAAWLGARSQTAMKRADQAAAGSAAVLESWKDFAEQLHETIRQDREDCAKQVASLRAEISDLRSDHDDCRRRLAELERRVPE